MGKPLLINFKPLDSLSPHIHDAVQFVPLIQDLMRECLKIDVRECNSWNELKQIPDDTAIVEFHTSLVRLLDTTPTDTEQELGAHAVVLIGYDLPRRQVLAQNSFGSGWGQSGYFWIPFDYIQQELTDAWIFDIVLN